MGQTGEIVTGWLTEMAHESHWTGTLWRSSSAGWYKGALCTDVGEPFALHKLLLYMSQWAGMGQYDTHKETTQIQKNSTVACLAQEGTDPQRRYATYLPQGHCYLVWLAQELRLPLASCWNEGCWLTAFEVFWSLKCKRKVQREEQAPHWHSLQFLEQV